MNCRVMTLVDFFRSTRYGLLNITLITGWYLLAYNIEWPLSCQLIMNNMNGKTMLINKNG